MVGQPPDRLCLTMTAAFLTSISARQAISSFLQQSSDGSSVELALGCAARQGFPKMLIHRWYRMLRPSAWLSWDTKLRQISRALFFQKAPQLKRKWTLVLRVCYLEIHHLHTSFYPHSCCSPKSALNSTSWQAIMLLENKVLLFVRACEDSCQTSYRCLLAVANQAKRKQQTKLFAKPLWIIWIYGVKSVAALFNLCLLNFCVLTWCPDFIVVFQCFFFSEQHCIVAAVKLDCCSLRKWI